MKKMYKMSVTMCLVASVFMALAPVAEGAIAVSAEATVQINLRPVATPAALNVFIGDSTTAVTAGTGTGPYSYLWNESTGNVSLTNAATDTVTIQGDIVGTSDVGCDVLNLSGLMPTVPFTVNVLPLPTLSIMMSATGTDATMLDPITLAIPDAWEINEVASDGITLGDLVLTAVSTPAATFNSSTWSKNGVDLIAGIGNASLLGIDVQFSGPGDSIMTLVPLSPLATAIPTEGYVVTSDVTAI